MNEPSDYLKKGKLLLKEDDWLRNERFRQERPSFLRALRMTLIATPILVGGMYWLMRGLPKEAFPPDFWAIALVIPLLALGALLGIPYLAARNVNRRCTIYDRGVLFAWPQSRFIPWRALVEWHVENCPEHPGYFRVVFRSTQRIYDMCCRTLFPRTKSATTSRTGKRARSEKPAGLGALEGG